MPRTKIAKSSKRNRDVAQKEEKIRECEALFEEGILSIRNTAETHKTAVKQNISLMKNLISNNFSKTTMGQVLEMFLIRFADLSRPYSKSLSDDEESHTSKTESRKGSSILRPGPLSSAKAARSVRRSKSASCDVRGKKISSNSSSHCSSSRESRAKMRTPIYTKALSSDRGAARIASPVTTFMRWPKPGEIAVSTSGSPLVTQIMPSNFAHLNIPVRDGILSLQPKKMDTFRLDIIEHIEPNTMQQLRALQHNLNKIINKI